MAGEHVDESADIQDSSHILSDIEISVDLSQSTPAQSSQQSSRSGSPDKSSARQASRSINGNLTHPHSYQTHQTLYMEWGGGDDSEKFVIDPTIYDYDNGDDYSDAASDFTADYSRHRKQGLQGLPTGLGATLSQDDDESSLSSGDGSYAAELEDEEYWSSAGESSSDADSRKLLERQRFPSHGEHNVDEVQGALQSSFDGNLLEDHTEFSVEEDPLFNASGTLRMFDSNPLTSPSRISSDEVWSDDEQEALQMSKAGNTLAGNESHDLSQVWRETSTGEWVPNSHHSLTQAAQVQEDILVLEEESGYVFDEELSEKKQESQPAKLVEEQDQVDQKPSSIRSITSVDSFAGERPSPQRTSKKAVAQAKGSSLDPNMTSPDGVGAVRSLRRFWERNPIVPSEEKENDIDKATDAHAIEEVIPLEGTEPQNDSLETLLLSPIEHLAPLKDHSRKPRKHRHLSKNGTPKKGSKKNKKKSKKDKTPLNELSPDVEQDVELGTEDDIDDDVSIMSECSTDSRDAAIGAGRSKRKKKESSRKAKKLAKKKRKKERPRKRGRRADYEESSDEDDEDDNPASTVADRVEAIFSNRKMIFDTSIRGLILDNIRAEQEAAESAELEDPPPSESPSKDATSKDKSSRKTRSRSKSVGESAVSRRSKSRARSKSKDPAKSWNNADGSKSRRKAVEATEEGLKRSNSGSETKGKSTKKAKSPSTKKAKEDKKTNGKQVKSKGTPTKHKMTLQDMIGEDEDSVDEEEYKLSETDTSKKGDMETQIKLMQEQIAKTRTQTEQDIQLIKKEFDRRKTDMREKIDLERKEGNAIGALMLLQKLIVNDYHIEGRGLKRTIREVERCLSKEIQISIDLTRETQEWQIKLDQKKMEIHGLQLENTKHVLELQHLAAEIRSLTGESTSDFDHVKEVLVGRMEDYGLGTMIPLCNRWEKPEARISSELMKKSYKLPKTSIFYNILNDDEYRLSFTS